MSTSSAAVQARLAETAAREELEEKKKIAEFKDKHGAERDAITATIDAALIVLGKQHQAAGESSSAFLKRLKIEPKILKTNAARIRLMHLYHPDKWKTHIPDFNEPQFSQIFTAIERRAIAQRFQEVLDPLVKSIREAIEAAKPPPSAANIAAEEAQQGSNAATAAAERAAAEAATASGKEKERLQAEAKRLEAEAEKARIDVEAAAAKARAAPVGGAGGSGASAAGSSARAPPPAAEAGGFRAGGSSSASARAPPPPAAEAGGFRAGGRSSARAPPAAASAGGFGGSSSARAPPADETGGFRAGGHSWNFGGSSSARAPPAGGFTAGGFTAGGVGATPWAHATASENYRGENFSAGAGPSRAPLTAANAAWLRRMHEILEREGGKGEPSPPEVVTRPPKSLGQLEREMLARQDAAAERAAGALERGAAAEAQRDAEGLAAFEAFMTAQEEQLAAEIALETRKQVAEQARRFRERYGPSARRGDDLYELATKAVLRSANRRREEEATTAAATFASAAQAAGRSRIGENSGGAPSGGASSGAASSGGASSDLWLSDGEIGGMAVVATSEEEELFRRDEFWEVLSNAKCKEKEKRNSFRLYGRSDENFNRFYERVKSIRRVYERSIEEPSSCTLFGGRRRSKKRAQRKRRVTRSRSTKFVKNKQR